MNTQHTPGPWEVKIGTEDDDWAHQWPTIEAKNYVVVGTEGIYQDFDTDMANARLIAAAPDLLEALQDLFEDDMEHVLMGDGKDDQIEAISKAKAAIAKATGETK